MIPEAIDETTHRAIVSPPIASPARTFQQRTPDPVWLFSSGPTGKGDPLELTKGWKFPTKLKPIIERIKPRDVSIFRGAIDTKELDFLEKFGIIRIVKAPVGDFHDWDTITAWVNAIAKELKK